MVFLKSRYLAILLVIAFPVDDVIELGISQGLLIEPVVVGIGLCCEKVVKSLKSNHTCIIKLVVSIVNKIQKEISHFNILKTGWNIYFPVVSVHNKNRNKNRSIMDMDK